MTLYLYKVLVLPIEINLICTMPVFSNNLHKRLCTEISVCLSVGVHCSDMSIVLMHMTHTHAHVHTLTNIISSSCRHTLDLTAENNPQFPHTAQTHPYKHAPNRRKKTTYPSQKHPETTNFIILVTWLNGDRVTCCTDELNLRTDFAFLYNCH